MHATNAKKRYVSVSLKTLTGVMIISSILTLVLTFWNVYLDYKGGLADLDVRFSLIEKSYVSSMAYSLWNVNKKQTQVSLDGIKELPDIAEVTILEGENVTFYAGSKPEGRSLVKEFDINYMDMEGGANGPTPTTLGKLVITASLSRIEHQVFHRAVYILIGQAVKTFVSSLLILILVNFLITRHLKAIKSFFERYDPKTGPSKKLSLTRSRLFANNNIVDDLDYLTDSINNVTRDLDLLYRNLEEKVNERTNQLAAKTRDIQTMFQNLKQGIFTIMHDFKIHDEYSSYLEVILKTNNIAGQDGLSVLLANTDIGNNDRSMIASSLAATIGEATIAFALNAHLLPTQITKKHESSVQILEIDWQPISSNDDLVEKVMVIIRDVTELRKLQHEAEQKKREIDVIRQIIQAGPHKVADVLSQAHAHFCEVEDLLTGVSIQDQKSVQTLFRIYHTIKGNVRTYNLSHLVEVVHNAEQGLSNARDGSDGNVHWEDLSSNHEAVKELMREYERGLAFSGFGESAGDPTVESEFVAVFDRTIQTLESPTDDRQLAILMRRLIGLRQQGDVTLDFMVRDIIKSLPSLANDLGKKSPEVAFEGQDLLIPKNLTKPLLDALNHIFRNCIDHGIESSDQRVAALKSPTGRIVLNTTSDDQHMQLRIWDDGRGLNLRRLEDIGRKMKLLPAHYEDYDIAKLVFSPNLSTAARVTEISGRGVGLDSVKYIVEKIGGSIFLEFTTARRDDGYRPFQTVISLPRELGIAALYERAAA